jgi:hypothetical protein
MLSRLSAARNATPPLLGDLPVIVLSRGLNASTEQHAAHAEMSHMSRNARHLVVADSYHEIHLSHPDVVVAAIRDVVASIRVKAPLRQSSAISRAFPRRSRTIVETSSIRRNANQSRALPLISRQIPRLVSIESGFLLGGDKWLKTEDSQNLPGACTEPPKGYGRALRSLTSIRPQRQTSKVFRRPTPHSTEPSRN